MRIDCKGIVGRYNTPKGFLTFYDTGIVVNPEDMAELLVLYKTAFNNKEVDMDKLQSQMFAVVNKIALQNNVYSPGIITIAEDGRIFVTEPFYETKEELK